MAVASRLPPIAKLPNMTILRRPSTCALRADRWAHHGWGIIPLSVRPAHRGRSLCVVVVRVLDWLGWRHGFVPLVSSNTDEDPDCETDERDSDHTRTNADADGSTLGQRWRGLAGDIVTHSPRDVDNSRGWQGGVLGISCQPRGEKRRCDLAVERAEAGGLVGNFTGELVEAVGTALA